MVRTMSQTMCAVAAFNPAQISRPPGFAEEEFRRLMGDYEPSLLRFTCSLVRDADLARDCVQDTFLRAYESLCLGRQINRQWLWKVARNLAMDEFRHQRRLQPESDDLAAPPFDTS